MLTIGISSYSQSNTKVTEKNILVLHSYHQGLEWTDNISKGFQSVFNSRSDVNLVIEYLDAKRNYNKEYQEALLNLYKVKSNKIPFTAIIVSDNAAFDFMKTFGDDYYLGVPVLYCGVNNLDTLELLKYPNFYGLGERADHAGTLDAVQKVFPERKNVLIINDNTLTGNAIREELERVMVNFEADLNFEILSDFTIESLKDKVKSLDSSWVIYLLVVNRDKNGKFISYRNGITQIKSVSKVPIFGSWDFYEGKGLFGGKITRGIEQGEYIARLAEKVVDGNLPNTSPQFYFLENNYVFDYNELKLFGIDHKVLPPDSLIINKPEKSQLFLRIIIFSQIILVIIVLSLIIWLRLRRKRAEYLNKIIDERTAELSKTNKELEDVIQKKDKFFSILAHDLRNQIGTFLNAALLLNNKNFTKKKDKVDKLYIDLLHSASQTNNLLEDLLYWGMQQFGKKPQVINTMFSPNNLINAIIESFQVNTCNISFDCHFDENAKIDSDPQIVKFILRNIIHNALKFSHKNGKVDLITIAEQKNTTIKIKDYGLGMTPEIIQSIYDGNPIRKQGEDLKTTTGLGLTTALEYLKMINGKLTIESEPDKGSTFTIIFLQLSS